MKLCRSAARILGLAGACALIALAGCSENPTESHSLLLFNFEDGIDAGTLETGEGVQASVTESNGEKALHITAQPGQVMPRVTLKAPAEGWDLSPYLYVTMDVYNPGEQEVLVLCRIEDFKWVDGAAAVPAGQSRSLRVLLKRKTPPERMESRFPGMNGMPGGFVGIWESPDMAKVSRLSVLLTEPQGQKTVEIENVRADGVYDPPSEQTLASSFFPFVDQFGQNFHADWPGKTHGTEDLRRQRDAEESQLSKEPGPGDWDQYGGWAGGPQLESTGYFRVEKYQGKWWFVDPAGRLFWSHGVDCVGSGDSTAVTGREQFFSDLPEAGTALAQFYGEGRHAAKGYYREHTPYKTYNFSRANLQKKYGEGWMQSFADVTHERLRNWGLNTMGNWSDPGIYLQRKTAYVATIGTGGRPIEGSEGNWRKFPDPFDPGFREALQKRMAAQKGKSAGDPWCLGYFVDNELSWGDETFLATSVLTSPADQPAKQELIKDLRAQYQNVRTLNTVWGTAYKSWEEILESRQAPDAGKAKADLARFNHKLAQQYFRICREEVKAAAPDNLYLGCRFDFHFYPLEQPGEDWLVRIAGDYCDVISFNRYRFNARDLVPPQGVDKPVIIGEFHFGALDRGLYHTGLRSVADQEQRAEMYRSYVRGALDNPYMVGTHWFQYVDQPLTGRTDGENYQIGFVDVCDTPYVEAVEASQEVGYNMYRYRMSEQE